MNRKDSCQTQRPQTATLSPLRSSRENGKGNGDTAHLVLKIAERNDKVHISKQMHSSKKIPSHGEGDFMAI